VSGTNNITETIFPIEIISLVQYRKMQKLQNSNYAKIKNSTGEVFDFYINLTDDNTGAPILGFGGDVFREINIISLRRNVVYQNSSAGIAKARIVVKIW
jgi:hypothetical protein